MSSTYQVSILSLTKKFKQRLDNSNDWIMNSPDSLVILMIMGSGISTLFFLTLSISFFLNKNWFFCILFVIFFIVSLKKFIEIMGMVRKTNIHEALGGITANEFVWHKTKPGGENNGNSRYENDESSNKYNEEGNRKVREEIQHIYRQ